MARNRETTRRVRRAAHKAYRERLRLRGTPRSDDLARAILAVIRGSHAHFVNIGGRQVLSEMLKSAHDLLESKGFRSAEIKKAMAAMLAPKSSAVSASGHAKTGDIAAAMAAMKCASRVAG